MSLHVARGSVPNHIVDVFAALAAAPTPPLSFQAPHRSGTIPDGYRTAMFCRLVWSGGHHTTPSRDGSAADRTYTSGPAGGRIYTAGQSRRSAGHAVVAAVAAITSETLNTNNTPSTQCGAFQRPDGRPCFSIQTFHHR